MSKGWDNATLKKLKGLMGKGLSTSEIGKRLGLSKNAVVGKLNRLGWNSKAGGAGVASVPVAKATTTKKTTSATKTATPAKKAASKKTVVTTKKTATSTKTDATKKAGTGAPKKTTTTPAKKTPVAATPVKTGKIKASSSKTLAMHQRIIQHSLEMASLKPNQCRWPIGDPDSENFHFCGETVFVGKPYCYEHCKQAYQFTPPKKK